MKIEYKKKAYEIADISFKQRLELTGLRTGIVGSDGQYIHGAGFGKFLVRVYELSGLGKDAFEGFSESDSIGLINAIVDNWFPNEKK